MIAYLPLAKQLESTNIIHLSFDIHEPNDHVSKTNYTFMQHFFRM
jgi:hypothetical protein